MIVISYLSDLVPGETAFIYKISSGELCDRLRDLGFTDGTGVECVAAAPLGGPKAYLVRGTLIALRKDAAKTVLVQIKPSSAQYRHDKSRNCSWD